MTDANPHAHIDLLVELRESLTPAVLNEARLEQLVFIALSRDLNTIATEDGILRDRVFTVIRWAYDRNKLLVLVDKALSEYDHPALLQAWSDAHRSKFLRASSEEQARTSTPDITPQPMAARVESNIPVASAPAPLPLDLHPVMLVARGLRDGEELRQNSLAIRRLRRPLDPAAAPGTREAMSLMLMVLRGTADRARLVYSDVLDEANAQNVNAEFDRLVTAIDAATSAEIDEDFEAALSAIEAAAAIIYNTLDVALSQRLADVGRTPIVVELRMLLEAWRSAVRFLHHWTLCREMLLAGAHRMPFPCFEARADADAVQVMLDGASPIDLEAKRAAWVSAITAAANTLSAGASDEVQFNEVWKQAIALSAGIFQSLDTMLRSYPARPPVAQ
jgi:hypothetical protein